MERRLHFSFGFAGSPAQSQAYTGLCDISLVSLMTTASSGDAFSLVRVEAGTGSAQTSTSDPTAGVCDENVTAGETNAPAVGNKNQAIGAISIANGDRTTDSRN